MKPERFHTGELADLHCARQGQEPITARAPPALYRLADRTLPWCLGAAALLGACGLVVALALAPVDAGQGQVHRIVFLHVPAAWLSLLGYAFMAVAAGWSAWLDQRRPDQEKGDPVSRLLADALAPTVATLAVVALWTGAMWGKPGWGAWWVWDARLSAQAWLLMLTLGFILAPAVDENSVRARRRGALLALSGLAQIPAVYLWRAQGSGSAPVRAAGLLPWPMLDGSSLLAMGLMLSAAAAWLVGASLHRLRSLLLEAHLNERWVQHLPEVRR